MITPVIDNITLDDLASALMDEGIMAKKFSPKGEKDIVRFVDLRAPSLASSIQMSKNLILLMGEFTADVERSLSCSPDEFCLMWNNTEEIGTLLHAQGTFGIKSSMLITGGFCYETFRLTIEGYTDAFRRAVIGTGGEQIVPLAVSMGVFEEWKKR